MKILAVLFAVLGFFAANNLLGTHLKMVSVKAEDSFYSAPSIAAESCTGNFKPGETIVVLEKIEIKNPTAVVMQKDVQLDGKNNYKYQLKKGDVYALREANLEKPNQNCTVRVHTDAEGEVELELPKNVVQPVDEGTWIHVRQKSGKNEGWMRLNTAWY